MIEMETTRGLVSWFGGPADTGMSETEPLAFLFAVETAPHLFLDGATDALGRNLDPNVPYIAMRFDYDKYPKDQLASMALVALVTAPKTGRSFMAWPSDWGPNENTGRVADISPGLMNYLGIETDDEVIVAFPYEPIILEPES